MARSMSGFFCLASSLGFVSAALGLWVSFQFDWPLGPAVVLAGAGLLLPSKVLGHLIRRA